MSDNPQQPAAPAGTGVIHDIGYRHYDGPRLGRGYLVRALFGQSLRGVYGLGRSAKSKVMPILLLVIMCLPALIIAAVVNGLHLRSVPLPYSRYAMVLLAVVAIFVAAQSPQLVSRDLRFRLTSLYFSRPLRRRDYVLAKYAAMVCALLVLLVAPLTILYGGAVLARLPVVAETRHYLLAVAGAVLFALVLAGVGLLIAAFTPRRGLGVAAVIAVLLVSYSAVSVVQGIAADHGRTTLAGYAGLFSPFTLVDGLQVWLLHAERSTPARPPGTTGGLVFLATTGAVVAGSYALLLLRYRKVSVS
jgi:ABC-2 type transport system permease protein